jgi:hypothetical protein
MRKTVSVLLVSLLTLSACGSARDSSLNPFNWFGGSQPAPAPASASNTNPLIPDSTGVFTRRSQNTPQVYTGRPIDTISTLSVDREPGGAIIRATGIASVQGVYEVRLTPANPEEQAENGVLTYRFEGIYPANPTGVGSPATRQITVARHVNDSLLAGVRTIRVEGAQNALLTRR